MSRSKIVLVLVLIFVATAVSAQNLRMGTRYHIIDREVESVTTYFSSNVAVTTARTGDGWIVSRIRSRDGRQIGQPITVRPDTVQLVGKSHDAAAKTPAKTIELDLQPLDAVNADLYTAWKSNRLAAHKRFAEVEAVGMRTEGPLVMTDVVDDVLAVRTMTAGYEAFSSLSERGTRDGRELPAFRSVLRDRDTSQIVGMVAYFEGSRMVVFNTMWHKEPLAISAAKFQFEPNMAWANIQLLSFVKSFADGGTTKIVANSIAIRPHDTVGCDGLHWLDQSILRPCCDDHDLCYEREDPNCTAWRSWFFRDGWSCTMCNAAVVTCMTMIAWMNYLGYLPGYFWYFPLYDPWNCYATWGVCPIDCGYCGGWYY